jgi:mRNA interferase MazF
MRRGDLVGAVIAGDYGKPRPTLIVQADIFEEMASLTLLPLTSDLRPWPAFRIMIEPTRGNGLWKPSQIMVDKAVTVLRTKVGQHIGRLDETTMDRVDRALARFLGLD